MLSISINYLLIPSRIHTRATTHWSRFQSGGMQIQRVGLSFVDVSSRHALRMCAAYGTVAWREETSSKPERVTNVVVVFGLPNGILGLACGVADVGSSYGRWRRLLHASSSQLGFPATDTLLSFRWVDSQLFPSQVEPVFTSS